MQIKEKLEDNVAVITLKGDLLGEPDTTTIREKIHSLVNDDVKHVVVDLGGVNYMNSSGLGTLISALTTMRNSGRASSCASGGKSSELIRHDPARQSVRYLRDSRSRPREL